MNLTPAPAPDPQQSLLFAPGELLAHGLRDAHSYPLVGTRTPDGVRSQRMPASERAWKHQLIEWSRTGNSYAALGLDCDTREAVERAAACAMGAGDLPTPNVYATRTASGHVQAFWLLAHPVHRGDQARAKPLRHLGRVAEYFRATLGADPGYVGVLSSNPVHSDYATGYPRDEPYSLGQLAAVIPRGWRTPRVPTTAEGKNCGLFAELCKLALRCSDDGLLTWARKLNSEFDPHLADAEVRGVWRSVCRYRVKWRSHGHQQAWLWRQAARGRRGGLVSRGGGRPRKWSSEAERLRAYRATVRKQANTDSTPVGALLSLQYPEREKAC